MPIKAHFDGSNSGKGWKKSKFIAVAGYALDDNNLDSFESGWQQVLDDDRFRPRAPYLHMKEIRGNNPESPFFSSNGWNDEKRKRLVADLIDYLSSLNRDEYRYFSCGVDNSAVIDHPRPFPSSIRICTHYCCSYVMKWYIEHYLGIFTGVHAFFDVNEPFKGDFEKLREKVISNRFEISANREAWAMVKTETEVVASREYPAMQAADLLAWATLRQMEPSGFLNGLAVRIKAERFTSWTIWNGSNLNEINLPF